MKWLFTVFGLIVITLQFFMMTYINDHVTWLEDRLSNQCLLSLSDE